MRMRLMLASASAALPSGRWRFGVLSTALLLGPAAVFGTSDPTAAAEPAACRVKDRDTGVVSGSLQAAVDAADAGHRLTVRGTCFGLTTIDKDLTIAGIRRAGAPRPALDGELLGTVLTVKRGVTVTLRGLTIRRGSAEEAGGGIVNRGALFLHDVVVRANAAGFATSGGGAGVLNTGRLTMTGSSSIRDNTSSGQGGGVLNEDVLRMLDSSSIKSNTSGGVSGGGVWNGGVVVMRGSSSIAGNDTGSGPGGGVWNGGSLRMSGSSSIHGNSSGDNSGGGVWNVGSLVMRQRGSIRGNFAEVGGGVVNRGHLVMNDASSIEGNHAVAGGGVANDGGLTLRDSSSIADNVSQTSGGGVSNHGSLVMRDSASITGNEAGEPGGEAGAGVWAVGGLDGVRWPPDAHPNVFGNTPDQVVIFTEASRPSRQRR